MKKPEAYFSLSFNDLGFKPPLATAHSMADLIERMYRKDQLAVKELRWLATHPEADPDLTESIHAALTSENLSLA